MNGRGKGREGEKKSCCSSSWRMRPQSPEGTGPMLSAMKSKMVRARVFRSSMFIVSIVLGGCDACMTDKVLLSNKLICSI